MSHRFRLSAGIVSRDALETIALSELFAFACRRFRARNARMLTADHRVNCEFTLALNNRTGKYFFCRDLIEATNELIHFQYYWRIPSHKTPSGYYARVLGRLAHLEVSARTRWPATYRLIPAISSARTTVFTDPRECVLHQVKSSDVVVWHDCGPLTHPSLYGPGVRELYELAVERIKAARPFLLFVSEASRREFVRLVDDRFPSMDIVYPPLRVDLGGDEEPVPHVRSPFLLTVGSIGERKNQWRAIRAFRAAGLAAEGFSYVICGGPEPGAESVMALGHSTPNVRLPGYVNDKQLRWLYRRAHGFVLPSLLEGFGLPAAEAIHYGLVPLVSANSALHEVTGDSAVLVDPLDEASITQGLRTLAALKPEERERRLVDLRKSIGRFTPEAAISAWRSALTRASAAVSSASVGVHCDKHDEHARPSERDSRQDSVADAP